MNPPLDTRLYELFVRYWDNTLSEAEAEEFEHCLATDPSARDLFQVLCSHAVVSGELPTPARLAPAVASRLPNLAAPSTNLTRRRLLYFLGGGAVAAAVAGIIGHRSLSPRSASLVRLSMVNGDVTLQADDGKFAPLNGEVPPGSTLTTYGPVSSAVLSYPDGTDVSFTGDSTVMVADQGRRLVLQQGGATANIGDRPANAVPFTLSTAEATLTGLSGIVLSLGRFLDMTVLTVQHGMVTVASPTGESLGNVSAGEFLTVKAHGECRRDLLRQAPDQFAWDLSRALPKDWHIGIREMTAAGPVVRPEFWFDPYHHAQMSQIRSNKEWAPGLFHLYPESVMRVRYWVDEPGPSQIVLIVRSERQADPHTGCLECNGVFANVKPRQWNMLEVKVSDMLDNINAPKFDDPWVGILTIFNTYRQDLGLKVSDFQIVGPEKQNAGSELEPVRT